MSSIHDWSTINADNANSDSEINWAEGQDPSTVNNSARAMMKRVKQFIVDIGGSLVAGGTGNALTLAPSSPIASLADGLIIAFRASATNSGAATINVNGLGSKSLRKFVASGEAALAAGELQTGGVYVAMYSSAANTASGGWLLLNPSIDFVTLTGAQTLTNKTLTAPEIDNPQIDAPVITGGVQVTGTVLVKSADAGATGGPDLDLYRDSASPAAADILARLLFNGEDSVGNKELYALVQAVLIDPTSTSEDAQLVLQTVIAGTIATRLTVGAGVVVGAPTGGDKGAGTVNATELYENGTRITAFPALAKAFVNFNGTGTPAIRKAHNVTSITDNGVGDYTINFTTALADADYTVVLTTCGGGLGNVSRTAVIAGDGSVGATLKTTTQLRIQTGSPSGTVSDMAEIHAVIF